MKHLRLFFFIPPVPKEHPARSVKISIALKNSNVFLGLRLIFFHLFRNPHIHSCSLPYFAQDPDGIILSI